MIEKENNTSSINSQVSPNFHHFPLLLVYYKSPVEATASKKMQPLSTIDVNYRHQEASLLNMFLLKKCQELVSSI